MMDGPVRLSVRLCVCLSVCLSVCDWLFGSLSARPFQDEYITTIGAQTPAETQINYTSDLCMRVLSVCMYRSGRAPEKREGVTARSKGCSLVVALVLEDYVNGRKLASARSLFKFHAILRPLQINSRLSPSRETSDRSERRRRRLVVAKLPARATPDTNHNICTSL